MRLRILGGVVTALLVLTGCSSLGTSGANGFVSGDNTITSLKPADRKTPGQVAGTTLDGRSVSLSDYLGKTVVVSVWGSWCSPCRGEAPMLAAAAKDLAGKGVEFLGIDSRDPSKAAAEAFVRNFGLPYPSIYDPEGRTLLAFRGTLTPNAVPSTVIIDAKGRVSGSVIGSISRTTLYDLISDAKDL